MANIREFAAIRPGQGLAGRVAALPYDVYSSAEAREETRREPLSFLGIDRAETQLAQGTPSDSPRVYEKAGELLWSMVDEGVLVREASPCFYLYELTWRGQTQTGLAACASIDDYVSGLIKKHENTRADKEEDRVRHVDACHAQTGPIFLTYPRQEAMEALTRQIKERPLLFSFTAPDGVRHQGWRIERPEEIREIRRIFQGVASVYIADGHHRAASAVRVGKQRRAAHPGYTGGEEFNWFLCVLFPEEELRILPYNRVVKDLGGLTPEAFLERLADTFEVTPWEGRVSCSRKGEMGLYLEGRWYRLEVKPEYTSQDPVEGLDVSILQNRVLGPVLGISDPRTDRRIDFIGGIRGTEELERRVAEDCAAAFALYPTSIRELIRVAEAGRLMPPKSTWFEPKLRSGLFIHEIEP